MLVDMVPLRDGSAVRPRADVVTATPVRGDLEFTMTRGAWNLDRTGNEPNITARLTLAGHSGPALDLRHALITKMHGDSFLVYGDEYHDSPGNGAIGSSTTFRQVWWCRIVRGAGANKSPHSRSPNALPLPA